VRRVYSAVAASVVAIVAVLRRDSRWLLVMVAAVMTVGAFELARLGRQGNADGRLKLLIVAVPLLALVWVFVAPVQALALLAGSVLFFAALLVGGREAKRLAAALGWFSFGLPYLVLPVWSMYEIHLRSPRLLLVFLVSVWCNDTAAFYVGSRLGRHKLSPTLSPNKTWEGSAAGLLAGIASGVLGSWYVIGAWQPSFVWLFCLLAPCAQAGDLVESLLKRAVGVKDSGSLLPGHGGILDRLDAIILSTPVFYALLAVMDWYPSGD
jgi:phosphatidate cytidylyltransferase